LRIRLTEVKPRRVSPTGVTGLNALSPARARAALLECCGSKRWADQVAAGRPYATRADALEAAAEAWEALDEDDRLAAFAAHARIGEPDPADPRGSGEQAGAAAATAAERRALRDANLAYEARFGHVFLVCATGLDAPRMLAALDARMTNTPEVEFDVASREQRRITELRLNVLFAR
jgi:2-oxo-4-hydroxy-4-carboxy-5-ureidoimidazoline decarboxylase